MKYHSIYGKNEHETTFSHQDDDVHQIAIVVSNDDFRECHVDINGIGEEVSISLLKQLERKDEDEEEEEEEDEEEEDEWDEDDNFDYDGIMCYLFKENIVFLSCLRINLIFVILMLIYGKYCLIMCMFF